MIRWIDSAMFSHDPESGVSNGMIPCSNIQMTISGVLCPARLSITNSMRSGGSFPSKVIFTRRPSCQLSHNFRFSSGLNSGRGGSAATT